jgi:hypothetical protein
MRCENKVMLNPLLFEPSWRCYNETFLTRATYFRPERNKIGFPLLDKSSDIMLKITYVDMAKLVTNSSLTSCSVPQFELEQTICSQMTPKSVSFCGPGTIYSTELSTKNECKLLLDQSTLPSSSEHICLQYSLKRMLKLLNIRKDYRDTFYETVLYQMYSELNKNQFFLSKLFTGAKQPVKRFSGTFVATSVSLYFRKFNICEIDSNWCLMSKQLLDTHFSTTSIYATPRVLAHCFPPQQNNLYTAVLADGSSLLEHLKSVHAAVPPLLVKLVTSITHPSQVYTFHYISHLGVVLPLAIHPNLCMTFAFYPRDVAIKTCSPFTHNQP